MPKNKTMFFSFSLSPPLRTKSFKAEGSGKGVIKFLYLFCAQWPAKLDPLELAAFEVAASSAEVTYIT